MFYSLPKLYCSRSHAFISNTVTVLCWNIGINHQENKSMKSIPLEPHFYTVKLGVYMGMGIHIFLIFAPKHRLWVLVRTASARQSEREPTIYVCVFFLIITA